MTKAGEESVPCEVDRAGVNFFKKPFRQNSNGVSELSSNQGGNYAATIGISELEQILKQKTFTRSEIQRLIAVLNSRITEESPSDIVIVERDGAMLSPHTSPFSVMRLEAPSTTSGSLKRHKHGDISSSQHLTNMENLLDELLLNIFIRLLSKQLAQMRSLSKSWNTLLTQSSFIKSHLHHSIHNKSQILLVFYDDDQDPPDFKPLSAHMCQSPHLQLPNFIKLPLNPRPESSITIIGSVNGLICSCYDDSVIQIWNPSLSTVLTLPPYSMPRSDNSIEINFWFGYDPKKDDYKVVKITGLCGLPTCIIKWWLQIEIYSMRNGTWEFITQRFPSHRRIIDHHDYVRADGHDGHLHWIGYINEKSDSERIVAFDLGSETFREMLLPNSILNNNCNNQLGVLDKKVCVFSAGFHAFEVWVMEEYGVAESWVKRHVFSQYMDFDSKFPFGFTFRNDFLVVINGRLVLYDPIAKKETIFHHYGPAFYDPINIVEYVDSLVWVAPARREMVDCAGQN